jgi:tetratricopeptide (TPR) repeat protein
MNNDEIKEIMDKVELLIQHKKLREANDLLKSIGGYAEVSGVLEKLGEISFRLGKYPEARTLLVESLERGISEQGIIYLSLIDFKEGKFDETLKWLNMLLILFDHQDFDLSSILCMSMLT